MYKVITSNMYLGADNREIKDGINYLKKKNVIKDTIDINVSDCYKMDKNEKNLKYCSSVVSHLRNIHSILHDQIGRNIVPILVGGDHSISIASVAHTVDSFEELAVIWIDAHADINTHETTNSGNIHGMSVASLLGMGNNILSSPFKRIKYLKPENIIYIGLRDVEKKEQEIINRLGIYYVSSEQIRKEGIKSIIVSVNSYLKQRRIKNLHISYDLDVVDPNEAPGVTTAVKNGMSFQETKDVLSNFYERYDVRALDIVEFNPKRDIENKTALLIKSILRISTPYF